MTLQVVIAVGCTILGALLGYAGFLRTAKKDSEEKGQHSGTVLTEIGYIKANTDDIKRKQEMQDERYIETSNRLTAVEASAKQAHHRIDRLEDQEDR